MFRATTQNQRNRSGDDAYGKCISVSFPYHELNLLEELDELAHQHLITRSQYLRRLIRKEKQSVGGEIGHQSHLTLTTSTR